VLLDVAITASTVELPVDETPVDTVPSLLTVVVGVTVETAAIVVGVGAELVVVDVFVCVNAC
jgi:hypothetical protein